MTEIPEHLLARARARAEELGKKQEKQVSEEEWNEALAGMKELASGHTPDPQKVKELTEKALADRWRQKQELASPSRFYGDGGTIHGTTQLDVEVDKHGTVIAVWFRCQMLPFRQVDVDDQRAALLRCSILPKITGVEVLDP